VNRKRYDSGLVNVGEGKSTRKRASFCWESRIYRMVWKKLTYL